MTGVPPVVTGPGGDFQLAWPRGTGTGTRDAVESAIDIKKEDRDSTWQQRARSGRITPWKQPAPIVKPCIDRAKAMELLRFFKQTHGSTCACHLCQLYYDVVGDNGVPDDG